ncbi:MAG TPA: hypothetical protein VKX17_28580 [Planctomycetota bacterium]|nr:hypothetical protein [Planctomycetota bacterium]
MLGRFAIILVIIVGAFSASALDEPKPDPEKYPQDTAEHALDTMAKALEAEDYAYFITWVVTPDSTKRTLDKYKTLEAAVAASKTEPAKVEGRKTTLALIAKIDKSKKVEGKDGDIAYVRFSIDDKSFMQFEKQAGGRWCFNPRARVAADKGGPK